MMFIMKNSYENNQNTANADNGASNNRNGRSHNAIMAGVLAGTTAFGAIGQVNAETDQHVQEGLDAQDPNKTELTSTQADASTEKFQSMTERIKNGEPIGVEEMRSFENDETGDGTMAEQGESTPENSQEIQEKLAKLVDEYRNVERKLDNAYIQKDKARAALIAVESYRQTDPQKIGTQYDEIAGKYQAASERVDLLNDWSSDLATKIGQEKQSLRSENVMDGGSLQGQNTQNYTEGSSENYQQADYQMKDQNIEQPTQESAVEGDLTSQQQLKIMQDKAISLEEYANQLESKIQAFQEEHVELGKKMRSDVGSDSAELIQAQRTAMYKEMMDLQDKRADSLVEMDGYNEQIEVLQEKIDLGM